MGTEFLKGLDLCRRFFDEAVKPVKDKYFPGLAYSAALIGSGSDVLGFDTPQSRDHDWGPRLLIFLSMGGLEKYGDEINRILRRELPSEVCGYSTNYAYHEDGTYLMAKADSDQINHRVEIFTVAGFFKERLGFDPNEEIKAVDWLATPENNLLMVTAGEVFHDGLAELVPLRRKLAYYPDQVWLYLLAAGWRRIAQEEAFMGRCGQADDELGSRLVAGRLVRDIMRLCFVMERRYAPYIKWFGSAFTQLPCAGDLTPILIQVLSAATWQERQTPLIKAYEYLANMHNRLGITESLPPHVSQFYKRPFLVIHADRFVEAIRAQIDSDEVLALPAHLGGYDQWIDSTDAQGHWKIGAIIKTVFSELDGV